MMNVCETRLKNATLSMTLKLRLKSHDFRRDFKSRDESRATIQSRCHFHHDFGKSLP
jgi:hypothetical protein